MAQQIQKVADKIPEIIITGTMNREEINKILDDADVFLFVLPEKIPCQPLPQKR